MRCPPQRVRIRQVEAVPASSRAALLRIWDLGHRLDFVEDPEVPPERLSLRIEGRAGTLQGDRAAAALTRVLPGLLWLRPLRFVPGAGKLAARVLHQR